MEPEQLLFHQLLSNSTGAMLNFSLLLSPGKKQVLSFFIHHSKTIVPLANEDVSSNPNSTLELNRLGITRPKARFNYYKPTCSRHLVPSLLRGSSFAASVHRGIFKKKFFFYWLRITSLVVCA